MNGLHTCACGNEIVTKGWNSNYGTILRCDACNERRQALIAEITAAIAGKSVETVYISSEVYDLLNADDFTVEISRRRAEKMDGRPFVVEA